jgi:hypothetical protein
VPEHVKKTDSRVAAIRDVIRGIVTYKTKTGEFFDIDGGEVTLLPGARRRTFAELRAAGLVTTTNAEIEATPVTALPLVLTEKGLETADEWGLLASE